MRIEERVELARFTTLGTGGPAHAFARPESEAEVEELLQWANQRSLGVAVVGLGSNLLAADEGVDALILKLGGELAAVETGEDMLRVGGGAANAVALHRARAAGLGGFEFACAIPGTIGGGVWMNAGAYGGDFAGVLERVLVATADGSGWLTPAELGLSYRHSELRHGQVVLRAELRLRPRSPDEIKAEVRGLNVRQRVQESRARAERRPDARGVRPQGASSRWSPDLAEARELHRERQRRHDRGRPRPHGRGAPSGARAVRRPPPARGRVSRRARAARAVGRSGPATKTGTCLPGLVSLGP
jgi:UDP-N-acetylenolpyruvoylglucosamine reductase